MAPSTLSLFLTVLVFAGAQGATKDLGEACDPDADTCTNSVTAGNLLACDTLANPDVCKLQVDQPCDGGNEAKCVTGAACDTTGDSATNQCKCGAGYTEVTASKTCAVTDNAYGGTCSGGPTGKGTCVDDNAVCSLATAGTCGCKTGYSGSIGASCKSGAKAAFASVTSLVLACIVCLLAIN